jgi:hypothetical protein
MPEVLKNFIYPPNPDWALQVDIHTDRYYSAQIGEVARIVHYLKKHALGRTISAVRANQDVIVFDKVGCSAQKLQDRLPGKTIKDVKQQGKYFWLEMSTPPHLVYTHTPPLDRESIANKLIADAFWYVWVDQIFK